MVQRNERSCADAERASAEFKNGMLEVSMPMQKPQTRQRQIPIKGGKGGAGGSSPGASGTGNPRERTP